jgi:amino acid permease
MKLIDTLLLALMVGVLAIGTHQIIVNGFMNSYWIFMFLLILFFIYNMRKNNREKGKEDKQK